jgi:hypothetical protein
MVVQIARVLQGGTRWIMQTWFERAVDAQAVAHRQLASLNSSTDACNAHASCSDCIDDANCGWCSVPVVYADGSPGAQCAGFDDSGKPSP